jgi:hypothetical protein
MGRACIMRRIDEIMQNIVETPEGRRPLERPMRRWEDNIKMDLK